MTETDLVEADYRRMIREQMYVQVLSMVEAGIEITPDILRKIVTEWRVKIPSVPIPGNEVWGAAFSKQDIQLMQLLAMPSMLLLQEDIAKESDVRTLSVMQTDLEAMQILTRYFESKQEFV